MMPIRARMSMLYAVCMCRRRSSIDRLRLMTWVDVLKTPHSPPSQYTMAMMCSQRNTASSVMPISSAPTD